VSSLWRVRVARADGDEIVLCLQAIHPDAGEVPSSKVFALRLLADMAPERLTREEGDEAYWDDALMARKAEQVIESVQISDLRNFPFDEDAAKRRVESGLRAKGMSPDDRDAWLSAYGQAWHNLWNDSGLVPSATLTIRLVDRSWLAEVRPGAERETAAYG
jgi:hypothetical protein